MKIQIPLLLVALFFVGLLPAEAQFRRPGFVTIDREDRTSSRLSKEEGAIYLEEILEDPVKVRVAKAANAFANLSGTFKLGTVFANQNATLLAVSERAYRIRAKAAQGQIAGWVSKAAIEGISPEFEENLSAFYDRYVLVADLIKNRQVALGMTVSEVTASIGPPDKRGSKLTQDERTDVLEYVSYQRVPQQYTAYDRYGRAYTATQYLEVENGRVIIQFVDDTVVSIEESEGLNFQASTGYKTVPQPIFLY